MLFRSAIIGALATQFHAICGLALIQDQPHTLIAELLEEPSQAPAASAAEQVDLRAEAPLSWCSAL